MHQKVRNELIYLSCLVRKKTKVRIIHRYIKYSNVIIDIQLSICINVIKKHLSVLKGNYQNIK